MGTVWLVVALLEGTLLPPASELPTPGIPGGRRDGASVGALRLPLLPLALTWMCTQEKSSLTASIFRLGSLPTLWPKNGLQLVGLQK